MKTGIFLALLSTLIAALAPVFFTPADAAHNQAENPEIRQLNLSQKDSLSVHLLPGSTKHEAGSAPENSTPPAIEVKNRKLVCLFFDDGKKNHYDVVLPILLENGFKATFGVVMDMVDTSWSALTSQEMLEMADRGMDIASHSYSHPDLAEVAANDLQKEIVDSKAYLEDMGIHVRTFVYPFYDWNENTVNYVKKAGYECARSRGPNIYNPKSNKDPDSKYKVESIEISNQDMNQFKGFVDKAGEYSVVCLSYHVVADSGYALNYMTPMANFLEQMRYLKENGFDVVLLPDIVEEPAVFTGYGTDVNENSATLHMTYDFKKFGSGYLQFACRDENGLTTYTSWVPRSGSGTYYKTVKGLNPGKTYFIKGQIQYNDSVIEGQENWFQCSLFSAQEQKTIIIAGIAIFTVLVAFTFFALRKRGQVKTTGNV